MFGRTCDSAPCFATVRPHEITSLPHDRSRSGRTARHPSQRGVAGVDRLERPHERRLLCRGLRQGDRHAVQPVRRELGIHAREDRHDLRDRSARHLRPRGQGGRSAAHHHADPRLRRQARALHPRHVPRNRRLSRRDQRADVDEHRLRHPPLRAVARLDDAAPREDGGGAQASLRQPRQAGRIIGIKRK